MNKKLEISSALSNYLYEHIDMRQGFSSIDISLELADEETYAELGYDIECEPMLLRDRETGQLYEIDFYAGVSEVAEPASPEQVNDVVSERDKTSEKVEE